MSDNIHFRNTPERQAGTDQIKNLNPRHIIVTKKELDTQLLHHSDLTALICALTIGEHHPRFEEWMTKACYHLQTISSFVYITRCRENELPFVRKAVKPPMKRYGELLFDACCENADECRSVLERLAREEKLFPESGIIDEMADRVFEKLCAFKRYTLPMLANVFEFEYFSFFRHILLYVATHDTYPEFSISPSYQYPLLPGMCECSIDFDY